MKEKAKEILLKLKEKHKELSDSIDDYARLVSKELDIPEDIAKTVVLDDITNKHLKRLLLVELFNEDILKDNGLI